MHRLTRNLPDLAYAIKYRVDMDPRPGSFLLTGSSRLLGFRPLPDALVGRMEIIELRPLSQGEIDHRDERFVNEIFGDEPNLRRLLALLAARTAAPIVVERLASDLQLPAATVKRYLALFEEVFLIKQLPAWSDSSTARALRRRKLLFTDSGIAARDRRRTRNPGRPGGWHRDQGDGIGTARGLPSPEIPPATRRRSLPPWGRPLRRNVGALVRRPDDRGADRFPLAQLSASAYPCSERPVSAIADSPKSSPNVGCGWISAPRSAAVASQFTAR